MRRFRVAKRVRQRRQRGQRHSARINLVSLMDIFTILVFFLLVNSSDVEVLPGHTAVELPEAMVQQKPKRDLIILVNQDDILLQGVPVVSVAEALAAEGGIIGPLKQALDRRAGGDAEGSRSVTIMGDKAIPYRLLKKVMVTCTETRFSDIALAVQRRVDEHG